MRGAGGRLDNQASGDHISADTELVMMGGLHLSPPPPEQPARIDLLDSEGEVHVDLMGLSSLRAIANTLGPTGILVLVLLVLSCW